MVTGWQKINGYWYYFYKNKDSHGGIEGVMAANTKIDGYRLSASGAMKPTANSQMALKAQAYSSSTGYLILVNRATCQVGIFTGKTGFWNQIKSWSCSPGASSSPTVAGTFLRRRPRDTTLIPVQQDVTGIHSSMAITYSIAYCTIRTVH